MITVSIIGCGNMGGGIITALKESGGYSLTVYDSDREKAEKFNLNTAPTLEAALEKSDVIILAVKPQIISELYDTLSEYKHKSFISILAGVPLEVLDYKIGCDNLARFMPNLAARSRKAVTAIAYSSECSEDFKKTAFGIASAFGSAFILKESLFPAFIGLSGSAIAFVFQFIHSLAMGAVEKGIPYNRAVEIAADTMESAYSLLKDSGKNPVELATMVCSAGGTTIAGMNALSENGFDNACIKAVCAATDKSIELEKNVLEKKEDD